jgi:hypothetical protein
MRIYSYMNSLEEFSHAWFDASSNAWKENKRRVGQSWIYVCKEEKCRKRVELGEETCKAHTNHMPAKQLTTRLTMTLRPRSSRSTIPPKK